MSTYTDPLESLLRAVEEQQKAIEALLNTRLRRKHVHFYLHHAQTLIERTRILMQRVTAEG